MLGSICRSTTRRVFHSSGHRLAITTVQVPSMGDSISEGTLVEILKTPGQAVQADDVICVLETDKVSVDVRTPVAGTVVEQLCKLDDNVEVGRPLFTIDDSGAPAVVTAPAASAPAVMAPTPVAAPAAAAKAPSSGHRTPLIQFLGKRSLLPVRASPLAQTPVVAAATTAPIARAEPSGPGVLSFEHVKRVSISKAEIDAINSGLTFL